MIARSCPPALTIARSGKSRAANPHDPHEKIKQCKTYRLPSQSRNTRKPQSRLPFIDGLVVTARAPTPDPIPNSAVKTLRANGTAS